MTLLIVIQYFVLTNHIFYILTVSIFARVLKDKNNESHELWIPTCQELELLNDMTMVFEDPEARRNLTLFGNTNIKIVPKGEA